MRARWLLMVTLPLLMGLTACETESTQLERAQDACRAQADAVDAKLNRADIANTDTSDTPFSAQGTPGINTAPLVERSVHDQNVLDCLNGTGALPEK